MSSPGFAVIATSPLYHDPLAPGWFRTVATGYGYSRDTFQVLTTGLLRLLSLACSGLLPTAQGGEMLAVIPALART
jgi:hypothetical protein